jgi:hypothetical protein
VFTRVVRGTWHRTLVYRRHWQPAMVTTSLAVRVHRSECLPRPVKVSATSSVDRVTARMLPRQLAEDYAEIAAGLVQTFGAAECRVRTDPKHRDRVVLLFLVGDPVTQMVAPCASRRTTGSRIITGGPARGWANLPASAAWVTSARGRRHSLGQGQRLLSSCSPADRVSVDGAGAGRHGARWRCTEAGRALC